MTNCAVTLGEVVHILHAVHSVTVKGDSIIMLISLLTCRYSMLNSGCKDLILHSLLAVVLPAACSLFITPSLVNPEWHGLISSDRIQRPYILLQNLHKWVAHGCWHDRVRLWQLQLSADKLQISGFKEQTSEENVQSELQMCSHVRRGNSILVRIVLWGISCMLSPFHQIACKKSNPIRVWNSGNTKHRSFLFSLQHQTLLAQVLQSINIWDNLPFFTLISVRL